MAEAKRDENRIPTLLGVSSTDGVTPVVIYADPVTHRLYVDISAGTGDVVGPALATDNAVVRFDLTTGKLIQNSVVTIADTTGNMAGVGTLNTHTIPAGTGTLMLNPMTTGGDVIYGGASGTPTRLANGTAGQVLTSAGTTLAPTWTTLAGSGDVSKVGTPVDNQVGVWTGDGTIEGTAGLTYDGTNLLVTGSLGATATRLTKGWFTDLEVTNAIAGSVTGNAGTVTNATLTTALTVNTGTVTLTGNVANNSVLTIGAGAVSVSGSNTGDQTNITGNAGTATALQTARTIGGVSFDGTANITVSTATAGFTVSGGDLALGANNLTMTGSVGATANRVTKLWATDIESTNMPTVGGTAILTSLTAPQFTTIELGHATDTTLARVSAGVIAVEGVTIPTISSTSTLTNKRINPRLTTAASYTTNTGTSLDIANCDQFEITAQAGALLFNAPGGTPTGGQKLTIRIKDNGTARALTYNAVFRAMGVALPTTTVINKTLYMGFIYNVTDTKWDLVAVAQEA